MIRRFSYHPGNPPRPAPVRTGLEEVPGDGSEDEDEAREALDDLAAAAGREWVSKASVKPGADGTWRDTEWHSWRGETG